MIFNQLGIGNTIKAQHEDKQKSFEHTHTCTPMCRHTFIYIFFVEAGK